jgi:hypothetical protein
MLVSRRARPVRAISIRQPHVELILRGQKLWEYRSRPTNIRERVYLYAGLRPADSPAGWRRVGKGPRDLPSGVIAGSVEIVDCRWDVRNDCYAYRLRNPRRLKKYLSAKNPPSPCFWRQKF